MQMADYLKSMEAKYADYLKTQPTVYIRYADHACVVFRMYSLSMLKHAC